MATGYTAELCEKEVDFKAFVLQCARAMGACVMQRDEPLDAPPREEKPTDYHVEALAKAQARLQELLLTSDEEATRLSQGEALTTQKRHQEYVAKTTETCKRLNQMKQKVSDWEPPTPDHRGLRDFMLEQLSTTIQYDGTVNSYYEQKTVPLGGAEWRAREIALEERNIAYHTTQNDEEIKRVSGRNKWIRELRASL